MDIPRLQKTLEAAGFTVQWFPTAQAAKEALVARFAGKTIGMGGSVTLRDLGLYEALSQRGTVYWHWQQPGPETLAQAAKAQVYLTSVNALAETGELVNIDGAGNRAAAVCFGPEQVYFVISHSKVVDGGINTAIARIKKTACPPNARRQGLDTACARTGMCGPDCHDSMCRLTLAVDRAPRGRKITVLFVEETLGY